LGGIFTLVPILIHLWFKKRLRKVRFSSLSFLKTSEAKRFGWLRLREILVLVSRCLFIACVAMSLAKPRLRQPLMGTTRTASVVLLLDNSYSMHYRDNFPRAKEIALDVLERYSDQSQFMVTPLCRHTAGDDHALFWTNKHSAIARIESTGLTFSMGSITHALSSLPWHEARHRIDRIYIGDGQAVSFIDYTDTMGPLYSIRLSADHNCGITHVALADPMTVPEETYDILATVQNYGLAQWEGTIALRDTEYTRELPCVVSPRSDKTIQLTLPRTLHAGTLLLEQDSLYPDNAFYFSFTVPREIKVLLVGTNPFIIKALKTGAIVQTPFTITNVAKLGSADVRLYDVIIVCGNYAITPGDRVMLQHIARSPAHNLIILLGNHVNQDMITVVKPYCAVGEHIDPTGYVTIDWIHYDHPVFDLFRDDPSLKTTKIYHYWSLLAGSGIQARLTADHPFIIMKDNVTIIATDLIPSSTDLIYKTSFIPLIYRIIMHASSQHANHTHYVGSPNPFKTPIQTPTGELLYPNAEFTTPGHYHIGDTIVGVNVVPQEGDIKPLGKAIAPALQIESIQAADLTGKDLSLFFLICALFFLLFEVFLLVIR
jgi:hypothetical protein